MTFTHPVWDKCNHHCLLCTQNLATPSQMWSLTSSTDASQSPQPPTPRSETPSELSAEPRQSFPQADLT